MYGMPLAIGTALIVVVLFIMWLVEVLTVRWVFAGKWIGFFGYEI